ncbi:hypothetical protein [Streptomyces uncialis]|uniref:hypothetical protein n=1 Tax=Streptomyces uncialis TaxID=1048205 RepID=UPI00093E7347|nr:hypothetical protein [Streptomyces uncialis]
MEGEAMKADFSFSRDWERLVFHQSGVRDVLTLHASRIAIGARQNAPKRRTAKSYWNEIRKHIEVHVEADSYGWRANVTIEDDPRVRHAMLQERGFTAQGRRIAGRRYIKSALLRARVE